VRFSARYYSSVQGRFTSPDFFGGRVVNPQTLNSYTYVRNNPLKYVDPTGYEGEDPQKKKGKRGDPDDEFLNTPDNPEVITVESLEPCGCKLAQATKKIKKLAESVSFGFALLRFQLSPISSIMKAIGGSETAHHYEDFSMAILPLAIETKAEVTLEETEAAIEAQTAELDIALESRVKEIHSILDRFAQDHRTTAALETEEGITLFGSSTTLLEPAQRAALKSGELAVRGPGHAEIIVIEAAKRMGYRGTRIAASRDICPKCAPVIKAEGIIPVTPLSRRRR
jgi:hypothetical protein